MPRSIRVFLWLVLPALLCSCGGPRVPRPVPVVGTLDVQFVDSGWDGLEVPFSGRCGDCGGGGRSPALRISGLPAAANEVIVEFNDLRIRELATNGGHGTLAMFTGGRPEITLPSVREETMKLPRGVRSAGKHRCVLFGHKDGAYKAPCGCGQGNEYVVRVMAVHREGKARQILAEKTMAMGIF